MAEINFKNASIFYDVSAPSDPEVNRPHIVFVHGVGADLEIWRPWRSVLSKHFPTVAINLPGHGGSFRPGAGFDWSFADLAAMLAAVAEAAGATELILIGESLGGTVCLAAVAGNAGGNSAVKAVVTCSTTHFGPSLNHVAAWRGLMAAGDMTAWSADMLEKRFAPGQCDATRRDWFDQAQQASDGETILALADLLVGLDMSGQLDRITCPVLIIQPDGSPFIPLDVPLALKQGLLDAELMIIPGTRHGIACSHAETCANAALSFFQRRQIL